MKELITDSRTIKADRMNKLLRCSICKPHRGENRMKVHNHKTRKNKNYQMVKK